MAKKDFSSIQAETAMGGKVFTTIEQAISPKGRQGTASPEEAAERAAAMQTQGRKGCKNIRINMAFTPENHAFLQTMARLHGQTLTKFCNMVIARYRKEHPEEYAEAKAIIDRLDLDIEG